MSRTSKYYKKKPPVKHKCIVCGEKFTDTHYQTNKCSAECRQEFNKVYTSRRLQNIRNQVLMEALACIPNEMTAGCEEAKENIRKLIKS